MWKGPSRKKHTGICFARGCLIKKLQTGPGVFSMEAYSEEICHHGKRAWHSSDIAFKTAVPKQPA